MLRKTLLLRLESEPLDTSENMLAGLYFCSGWHRSDGTYAVRKGDTDAVVSRLRNSVESMSVSPVSTVGPAAVHISIKTLEGKTRTANEDSMSAPRIPRSARLQSLQGSCPSPAPITNAEEEQHAAQNISTEQCGIKKKRTPRGCRGASGIQVIVQASESVRPSDKGVEQCMICQDPISPATIKSQCAACKIIFHGSCVNSWWKAAPDPNCPIW